MKNWKNKGWVRLHRCIEDNPLWFAESFTRAQAWIDLFLNANHRDSFIIIRGNKVTIKRGQLGWSEVTMTKRWGWSKGKVKRFLRSLEVEQQIIQQKDRYITTIVTILNYERYQSDTADSIADVQQTVHKQKVKKDNKLASKARHPKMTKSEQHSDEGETVISPEGDEIKVEPKGNAREAMLDLLRWAEKKRSKKFTSPGKQFKAMAIMRKAEIQPTKIKARWLELEDDEWWSEKGFDFMDVSNSFNKK